MYLRLIGGDPDRCERLTLVTIFRAYKGTLLERRPETRDKARQGERKMERNILQGRLEEA